MLEGVEVTSEESVIRVVSWRASIRLAGARAFVACFAEDARFAPCGALLALIFTQSPFCHVDRAELRLGSCEKHRTSVLRPSNQLLRGVGHSSLVGTWRVSTRQLTLQSLIASHKR